jgi:hypothetical protein
MTTLSLPDLHTFIVKAKAATYVGDGQKSPACRPGSHDLTYTDAPFAYLDSYFGGTDFIGQEVVYYQDEPVWAMNYYGYIIRPDLIEGATAGQVIKASLSAMYREGRFLGGFEFSVKEYTYTDTSDYDFTHFTGKEWITHAGIRVYELVYGGGLVKP